MPLLWCCLSTHKEGNMKKELLKAISKLINDMQRIESTILPNVELKTNANEIMNRLEMIREDFFVLIDSIETDN
jgi:hypothetical protein